MKIEDRKICTKALIPKKFTDLTALCSGILVFEYSGVHVNCYRMLDIGF